MRRELLLQCTPEDFANMLYALRGLIRQEYGEEGRLAYYERPRRPGMIEAHICGIPNRLKEGFGAVTVVKNGTEGSRLTLLAADSDWPHLAPWWDRLVAELKRNDLLKRDAPAIPPEDDMPKVPSRPEDLRRWEATWEKIKPLVSEGQSLAAIQHWLDAHSEHLRYSEETLRKIIKAGRAGLLG